MDQKLIVFCRVPGRWRAGVQHPQIAAYPLDHFSAAQLAEIRRDDAFSLALGDVASGPMIDQLMGHAFEREHKAAVKAAALADKQPIKVLPGVAEGAPAKGAKK